MICRPIVDWSCCSPSWAIYTNSVGTWCIWVGITSVSDHFLNLCSVFLFQLMLSSLTNDMRLLNVSYPESQALDSCLLQRFGRKERAHCRFFYFDDFVHSSHLFTCSRNTTFSHLPNAHRSRHMRVPKCKAWMQQHMRHAATPSSWIVHSNFHSTCDDYQAAVVNLTDASKQWP
jgi:hypothetical protein